MTDGNTYAINKYLDEREDYDALQEVTAELEQAEARIEELEANAMANRVAIMRLEAKLAKALEALDEAVYLLGPDEEDMMMKAGVYRVVTTLAKLSKEHSDEKGQDDAE